MSWKPIPRTTGLQDSQTQKPEVIEPARVCRNRIPLFIMTVLKATVGRNQRPELA